MDHYCVEYTAASHVGSRRRNEDNFLVNHTVAPVWAEEMCREQGRWDTERIRVAAVCDGIGGGVRGDTASLLALRTIDFLVEEHRNLPLEELILLLADGARETVRDYFARLESSGGCTLSMVVLKGDRWAYLNIGDSPAFLWNKETGTLAELSLRHNLEWEKRRRGEEPNPGDECYLLCHLGRKDRTGREMAHVTTGSWNPGDGLLICSDGISNAFDQETLSRKMAEKTPAEELVQEAVREPWADNCTAVCLWAEQVEKADA